MYRKGVLLRIKLIKHKTEKEQISGWPARKEKSKWKLSAH